MAQEREEEKIKSKSPSNSIRFHPTLWTCSRTSTSCTYRLPLSDYVFFSLFIFIALSMWKMTLHLPWVECNFSHFFFLLNCSAHWVRLSSRTPFIFSRHSSLSMQREFEIIRENKYNIKMWNMFSLSRRAEISLMMFASMYTRDHHRYGFCAHIWDDLKSLQFH